VKYRILIERVAQKNLSKIPQPHRGRLIDAIRNLADTPRPSGVKKLSGRNAWRIRAGNYRVIYEIDDKESTLLVVTLGDRKDVYR
jgi:mRNA interferase RelE/StbE